MDNEVKKALELYRQGYYAMSASWGDPLVPVAGVLAAAYAKEHPADEDEPITPEWLNGLLPWDDAYERDNGGQGWQVYHNGHELDVWHDVNVEWFVLYINDDPWPIPLTTRGQLLRLLKELEQ